MIPDPAFDATGQGVAADDPEYLAEPARTVRLLAETLGRLHASAVPADAEQLDRPAVVADLTRRLAGLSPEARVGDPAYRHATVADLQSALAGGADPSRDAASVPTHGAPTLDRLRVADGLSLGLSDWDGAAVAPPARDVAVALRALVAVFGPGVAPAFAAAYPGVMPSVEQVDWWVLADVLGEAAGSGSP